MLTVLLASIIVIPFLTSVKEFPPHETTVFSENSNMLVYENSPATAPALSKSHKSSSFSPSNPRILQTSSYDVLDLSSVSSFFAMSEKEEDKMLNQEEGEDSVIIQSTASFWVNAGDNGNGSSRSNAAGNITYILESYDVEDSIIKVQPGVYNTSIENFSLQITEPNVTIESIGSPSETFLEGELMSFVFRVYAENVTISGFTITQSRKGIVLDASYCTLENNIFTNNYQGVIGVEGTRQHSIKKNTFNENDWGIVVENQGYGTIQESTFSNNTYGIFLQGTRDSTVTNNILSNNYLGIRLEDSSKNMVTNNKLTYNHFGLHLKGRSRYNTIRENKLVRNAKGLSFDGVYNCTAYDNTITDNYDGIIVTESQNNTLKKNIIANNVDDGLTIRDDSEDNLIYRNDFIGNGDNNAIDFCDGNYFNNSNIGNYWGNYNGSDENGDGIGDTPYKVPANQEVRDYLPSIEPFTYQKEEKQKEEFLDKLKETENLIFLSIGIGGGLTLGIVASFLVLKKSSTTKNE